MTHSEVCKSQLIMVQTFARAGDFKNALTTIDNFRAMDLDKKNPDVKVALERMKKAETMLKDRI